MSDRVLKPGGSFVEISYGSPKTRMHCLMEPQLHWNPLLYTISKPNNNAFDGPSDAKPDVQGPFEPQVSMCVVTRSCCCWLAAMRLNAVMTIVRSNLLACCPRHADAVHTNAEHICLDGDSTPHHDAH